MMHLPYVTSHSPNWPSNFAEGNSNDVSWLARWTRKPPISKRSKRAETGATRFQLRLSNTTASHASCPVTHDRSIMIPDFSHGRVPLGRRPRSDTTQQYARSRPSECPGSDTEGGRFRDKEVLVQGDGHT